MPRKGEPGFETWTENDQWPPLGAAAWNTASYDAELELVYFSTGQPTPWTTASRGPGDSLYSNTLLAVEADTGKLRWHFQLVPGDEWDRSAYESMLVDLAIDGVQRKALIMTGKIGWGVVLDRATGEFLHAFRTAYDNTITGWTERGPADLRSARDPEPEDVDSGKVFEICPHIHGARNLQAPSFSPHDGVLLSRRQQLVHERAGRRRRCSGRARASRASRTRRRSRRATTTSASSSRSIPSRARARGPTGRRAARR